LVSLILLVLFGTAVAGGVLAIVATRAGP